MASIIDKSSNLSLYSIPAVWLISLFPALYVTQLAANKFDNTQPRNSIGKVATDQSIDSRTKARIARAHGAQLNGFENVGLYAAAVVAGNMAGLDSTTLNYLSGGYIVSRIAYNLIYINGESPGAGYLRTGVFLSGVGCVMTLFIKAGGVLQAGLFYSSETTPEEKTVAFSTMAGPLVVPPPPPGGPQPMRKTMEIIGTFRPMKLFKLSTPETSVTSLDFDDTGEFLVAACDDDSLQLYNAKEGKHVKSLLSKKYGAHLARFTHHSQSILYASTKYDETIRYLSTHDFQYLRYFKGHTAPVTSLALNPAADTFLSCSLDNTVRLWNLSSPSPQARLKLSTPHLAAYDPSATVIAIASSSTASILLYDLRNYDKPPFSTFDLRHLSPPATPPTWTKLEFSNDGKSLLLATSAPSGHILLDAFKGDLKAYCAYPPLKTPFVASRAAPGSSLGPLGQGDVSFSADGRYLVGGSGAEHVAVVWDTQGTVVEEGERKLLRPMASLPCRGRVSVSEWNPRFNMLATGDRDVVFWLPDEHVA